VLRWFLGHMREQGRERGRGRGVERLRFGRLVRRINDETGKGGGRLQFP